MLTARQILKTDSEDIQVPAVPVKIHIYIYIYTSLPVHCFYYSDYAPDTEAFCCAFSRAAQKAFEWLQGN